MIDIVIPLGGKVKWEYNELKYMLRSLDTYLKDFRVFVYGDAKPKWLTGVKFIKCQRFYPREATVFHGRGNPVYENYFSVLDKLEKATKNKVISEQFYWTYDDVCLLKIPKDGDLKLKVALSLIEGDYKPGQKHTRHDATIIESLVLLANNKRPTYNYETHLPRCYDKKRLLKIFKKYKFRKLVRPYSFSTLYFNTFYDKPHLILKEKNTIKAGFYDDDTKGIASFEAYTTEEIEKTIKGKLWLNYDDKGIKQISLDGSGREPLKEYLEKRFSRKSRFEK